MLSVVSIIVAICGTYFVHGQPWHFKPPEKPPTTRKPTNRPTYRPIQPTPPPSPFARPTLVKIGRNPSSGGCTGGPGPCVANCDKGCSASNTSPYTCPVWTYDNPGNNEKCRCQFCAYTCGKNELTNAQYDVEQCKIVSEFNYVENNIGPAVQDLFLDLEANLAGAVPVVGPFISAGLNFRNGIFRMVRDKDDGKGLADAIQEHTEKNNQQLVKCMDQKITGVVSDNVEDIMEDASWYYHVAAIYEVKEDLSNADEKKDRLKDAWMSFNTAIKSRFDNVGTSAQYYKDLLLPLQDFVKAYELLCLDYLRYMYALDYLNYPNDFAFTINAAQTLLAWIKKAREMIVDKQFLPRMYRQPCANDREMVQWMTEWENQFDADNVHPILNLIRDLHELNRLLGAPECTLDVLSTEHISTNDGKYFNFDSTALDAILGRSDWHHERLKVGNGKTVVVSKEHAYGRGDAFGRYEPYGTAKNNDWSIGDKITFAICQNGLFADTAPYQSCSVDVLSTEHSSTNGGKYFNFDSTALDAILGRSDWDNEILKVGNGKTVRLRKVPFGRGDAFGRYEPYGTAKDGDWSIGDKITFADCQKGLWRKGKAGASCDQTCNAVGKRCDSDMQSTVRSCEDIAAAASQAGVSCASHSTCFGRTDRDREYAGTPFIDHAGYCYFLSDGARSVCNSNADKVGRHSPLCYCV